MTLEAVHVADVGDGLCMAIDDSSDRIIQIDCGSSSGKSAFDGLVRTGSFCTAGSLVISHLHSDHYNGFIRALSLVDHNQFPHFKFQQLYYPKIPTFSRSQDFFIALITMSLRVLGEKTGVAEWELLDLITTLNGGTKPRPIPLFAGKRIRVGHSAFIAIWPPAALSEDDATVQQITKALELFNRALLEDAPTRELYQYAQRIIVNYSEKETRKEKRYPGEDTEWLLKSKPRRLPDIVSKANKALIKAANRFSLAFHENNNELLFLGDVETKEINLIINNLVSSNKKRFNLLVTPHHGTHWDDALKQIKCQYAISSCGSRHFSKLKPGFMAISRLHYATYINGDLHFIRI